MTWESYVTFIATVVAVPAGIAALFTSCYVIDKHMPDELRDAAQRVFEPNVDPKLAVSFFISCFDKIFSSTARNRPKFSRCVLFSLFVYFVILSSWCTYVDISHSQQLGTALKSVFSQDHFGHTYPNTLANAGLILVLIFGLNAFGDYFSLWETRWILEKLRTSTSLIWTFILWAIDIIVSAVIFLISLILSFFVMSIYTPTVNWRITLKMAETYSEYATFQGLIGLIAFGFFSLWYVILASPTVFFLLFLSFCTTFTTTLWAGFSVLTANSWTFLRLGRILPRASEQPFGTLTLATIALIVLCVSAFALLLHFLGW